MTGKAERCERHSPDRDNDRDQLNQRRHLRNPPVDPRQIDGQLGYVLGDLGYVLSELGDVLANHPRAGKAILEMMRDRQGIYETLLVMHEAGLLGSVFPDFEEIRCRVIRDFFHMYTVDEHSLIAIRQIEKLPPKHQPRAPIMRPSD